MTVAQAPARRRGLLVSLREDIVPECPECAACRAPSTCLPAAGTVLPVCLKDTGSLWIWGPCLCPQRRLCPNPRTCDVSSQGRGT